jgi:hypothetical protein
VDGEPVAERTDPVSQPGAGVLRVGIDEAEDVDGHFHGALQRLLE